MDFFNSAVDVLQTLVIALGAGLCIWGGINLWKATATTTPVLSRRVLSSSWRARRRADRALSLFPCSPVSSVNLRTSHCNKHRNPAQRPRKRALGKR
ncbi:Maff2 family mobile element protein [Mesotoga sp.]|uniref:Maff2 family mobile element protein n=1 Tax=Mesotoga sp. TaxID=2053577 RepID=UPI00345EEFB8